MGFPTDKATKTWEHAGLQCAIAPAGCNPNGGTAYNGYVRVPQGCDWHSRDYDTINQIMWDNEGDWPEDMLDPEHMPTSPYETAWTMDRLQDAVNAWAKIITHRSPLRWLLDRHSKEYEKAVQAASVHMRQLGAVAGRIAEIAGSTR